MSDDRGKYQPLSYFQLMEVTLRELLVEKGILTEAQGNGRGRGNAGPHARARRPRRRPGVDRRRVQEEIARQRHRACEELGLEMASLKLVVVENTPQVHNAIVCTLCSCYPRMLLGIPPTGTSRATTARAWSASLASCLKEFGLQIPESVQIRVHDSTADMRYMVLPLRPPGTDGWAEERLATLVSRDAMIGVAVPALG